ncbi:hypothetical protein [Mesorhizobium sp. LNJC384A00]|uniref:hypothetical protein n=1 Tax=Mesorhizobium sp. LNJC384A00 TaxID=1287268 RepID=UPI0032AFDFAF
MQRAIPTLDHQTDAGRTEEAADWFAANRLACPKPIIPTIRRLFGLSALEACQAIRTANLRADWPLDAEEGGADASAS